MGKITLTNIAEELAVKGGLSKEAADKFVRAFVATLEEGLRADNIVKIKGLGTFKLMQVSDRDSVDVSTGERITIKGYTKVSFTPDSAMKEFVNRPFAHFEPTELNEGYPTDEDLVLPDAAGDVACEGDAMEVAVETPTVEAVVEEATEDDGAVEPTETLEPADSIETVSAVDAAVAEVAVMPTENLDSATSADAVEEGAVEENIETLPVADEDVEAPHAAEEVVEEAAVAEEIVDVQSNVEQVEEIAPAVEEVVTESKSSDKKTVACQKRKKRRGCGCTVVALLVLVVFIAVVGGYFSLDDMWVRSVEEAKGHGDIMVKTNLEEELGAEWGDDAKVEESLPIEKQSDEVTLSAPKDAAVEKQEESHSVVAEEAKPVAAVEVAKPVAETPFCAVAITASLEKKTIKDITPADTTDYIMDGTLLTHSLKSGETIISLAKKYYSDKRLWPYIVKYNNMKNFNSVAIGQKIKVPILKEKTIE